MFSPFGFLNNVATGLNQGAGFNLTGDLTAAASLGLGAYSAYSQNRARQRQLRQTNSVIDHQTGLLNATSAEQAASQQAALLQMEQQAQASQASFNNQALLNQFFTSQLAGTPNPNAGQLAPYPKGDPGKPNEGHQTLSG